MKNSIKSMIYRAGPLFDNVLLWKKRSKNNDLVQTVTKKLQ